MISEKIRGLRENKRLTQEDLAKQLGVARTSVEGWELGTSVPSTKYLVELAKFFRVTTDYLLGITAELNVSFDGLTEEEKTILFSLLHHFTEKKNSESS